MGKTEFQLFGSRTCFDNEHGAHEQPRRCKDRKSEREANQENNDPGTQTGSVHQAFPQPPPKMPPFL
jgi:hypothetical protein